MGRLAQPTGPLRRVAILGSRGFPSTYGGYETLVRYLARAWVGEGLAVTVYCRSRDQSRARWTTEGVECVWTPGRDTKSLSTLTYGASSHLVAARTRIDAALVLNVANGFFLPFLRAAGIPTAVNTDGIEWERGKWNTVGKRVFLAGATATARFADVLIADSREIARIWQDRFRVASEFVPYGAPVLEDVADDRVRALRLVPGEYALIVARLIPENNVDLILDALDVATPAVPAVVVGSANYEAPIEARLRDADHAGRLRWLGHVSDQTLLTQLWAHAGVYLHGHSVGGTNPGLLQALGAGAPTLALDTPFNREVIGTSDQLFPADVSVLAKRISQVLNEPDTRSRMREHGQAQIAEHYAWPTVVSRYREALELAMLRRSGAKPHVATQ